MLSRMPSSLPTRKLQGRYPARRGSRRAALTIAIAGVVASSAPAPSLAQIPELERAQRIRAANDLLGAGTDELRTALEAPVDPREYRIVPGDQLLLGIWGTTPESYRTVVTPDGHLVVPDLIAVDVHALTLEAAAESIRSVLAPLYPRARIELHLVELGSFRVAVTGAVARPGFYDTNGAERLSDIVEAAEGFRREASLRRIRIRSVERVGTAATNAEPEAPTTLLDHGRWYVAGDPAANPRLRPGDVVEVPLRESYVEVAGAVGGPPGIVVEEAEVPRTDASRPADPERVLVEWIPGDRIADVLAMAGGLSDAASGRGLLRVPGSEPRGVDLLDPEVLGTPVPAFTRLEVEHADRWIYVVGAVRTPGRYPYYAGLAPRDYVLLAGGETENGRTDGWKLIARDGTARQAERVAVLEPGATLRVPERRSYWITRVLTPLTSAAALAISIVVLVDRNN